MCVWSVSAVCAGGARGASGPQKGAGEQPEQREIVLY